LGGGCINEYGCADVRSEFLRRSRGIVCLLKRKSGEKLGG